MKGNLLYSKFTDLNANPIKKKKKKHTFTETTIITFNQICGLHGLTKLTHKTTYHTDLFYNTQKSSLQGLTGPKCE